MGTALTRRCLCVVEELDAANPDNLSCKVNELEALEDVHHKYGGTPNLEHFARPPDDHTRGRLAERLQPLDV
jgi:hypothetical protein